MKSILFTGLMVLFWGLNLLSGTGLGYAYHIDEIAQVLTVVMALWCLFRQFQREGGLRAPARYFYVLVPMAAVFLISGWLGGQGLEVRNYLWAYLIIYIFASIQVRANALRLAGMAYGVLGAAILFIYGYMDALDGWNGNSIAMVGLFSFLMFTIPYFGTAERRSRVLLPVVGLVYVFLLGSTESRSCMIAVVLELLVVFQILPTKRLLRSRMGLWLVLLVPLFVAGGVALISGMGFMEELNSWSIEQMGKPLFNGRDEIWQDGFHRLAENFFFGSGTLNSGYWHNSAIACLATFGIVGYGLWIKGFHTMLLDAQGYTRDICVAGGMTAFLVLWCQQAVELGLFGLSPNLLPYVMLGVILGRVRFLKEANRYCVDF